MIWLSMAQDVSDAAQETVAPAPRRRSLQPAQSAPELYAALDLGTNSCRMLIAAPESGHFRVIDAFAKSVRLGAGLERTGHLSHGAIGRTLAALEICAEKLRRFQVENARLVATEACRRARNGNHFLAMVARETGLRLEVIRPEEEARLAVISCAPLVSPAARQVLVFDIGGGSTELVWIDLSAVVPEERAQAIVNLRMAGGGGPGEARMVDFISVPLGVATLHDRFADVVEDCARFALMSWYFEEQIVGFKPYLETLSREDAEGFQMIGTSGTVTTVGAAHLGLRRYDRRKVDGMHLSVPAIDAVIKRFLRLGPVGRRSDIGLGRDRSELIMSGAAILQTLLRIWPTELDAGGRPRPARGHAVCDDERARRIRPRDAARVSERDPPGSGRGRRDLRVRVKTARGRKLASTRWLERQLNDPYVARARAAGYRSRAAYKLAEIDDKLGFLVPGARVLDLGAAPGGWTQVAVERVNAGGALRGRLKGRVIGLDLLAVDPIAGAELHQLDFLAEGAEAQVRAWLGGRVDAVISDMAPAATGHASTDHLRIMALCEAAAELAMAVLEPGGTFVAKVLAGGAEAALVARLNRAFARVAHLKPPASRPDSSEKYVVATGFRG